MEEKSRRGERSWKETRESLHGGLCAGRRSDRPARTDRVWFLGELLVSWWNEVGGYVVGVKIIESWWGNRE
jgi:hypothetical protein